MDGGDGQGDANEDADDDAGRDGDGRVPERGPHAAVNHHTPYAIHQGTCAARLGVHGGGTGYRRGDRPDRFGGDVLGSSFTATTPPHENRRDQVTGPGYPSASPPFSVPCQPWASWKDWTFSRSASVQVGPGPTL